jgi:hypothetical protein
VVCAIKEMEEKVEQHGWMDMVYQRIVDTVGML